VRLLDECSGTNGPQPIADDVGFDRGRIDRNVLDLRQPLREARRQVVRLAEPRAVMIKGMERARSDDAGLPESPTELLLEASSPRDEVARPRQA
jgi:hypothetical protein